MLYVLGVPLRTFWLFQGAIFFGALAALNVLLIADCFSSRR